MLQFAKRLASKASSHCHNRLPFQVLVSDASIDLQTVSNGFNYSAITGLLAAVYLQTFWGLIQLPLPLNSTVSIPGFPPLQVSELPSFISDYGSSPAWFDVIVIQFSNVDGADWVFFNTFYELEKEVLDWMSSLEELHEWPDGKPKGSVLYVSFGSLESLEVEQMEELAWGLKWQTATSCGSGLIQLPLPLNSTVSIPGFPPLQVSELPSFISDYGSSPAWFDVIVIQFSNVDGADWVFFNTFYELEKEVLDWMSSFWKVWAIGPTVPSMYLDERLDSDVAYGVNLFKPELHELARWQAEGLGPVRKQQKRPNFQAISMRRLGRKALCIEPRSPGAGDAAVDQSDHDAKQGGCMGMGLRLAEMRKISDKRDDRAVLKEPVKGENAREVKENR
ncbi:hypothetical protein F3Y22_tig00110216pilonHSYRG00036 [Hibiscus syriacus]|uniref:Uncharacterized protein n=1 Tax=Hibiscus syriacus TaxID=106335 RepID=A0A6A3B7B1_HIBSY|nr:hypothetical protein F3Y22_tig00110216pilonHSYRG00036 [Hibiscus syriacus]